MSVIKLNSINVSATAVNPDFYVASLINTDSGFTYPKLIYDQSMLDAYFGQFDYCEMYKALIKHNIPVLLLPIVTRLSPYNRCSLRLNSGSIQYCHPKWGLDYEYRSMGQVLTYEYHEVTVFRFQHDLGYRPKLVILRDGTDIQTQVQYIDENTVELQFNEISSGLVSIEVVNYPKAFIEELTLNDDGPTYIELESPLIPELVVTNEEGYLVEVEAELDLSGTKPVLVITKTNEDKNCLATVRDTPMWFLISEYFHRVNGFIQHNLNHYPAFTMRDLNTNLWMDTEVDYVNKNRAALRTNEVPDFNATYNMIIDGESFDFLKIYKEYYSFNHILDFTNVPLEAYQDSGAYIIIELNRAKYLFYWGDFIPIEKTYYDVDYHVEGDTPEEMVNYIKSTISQIIGSENCTNLKDRIKEYLDNYLSVNEYDNYYDYDEYFDQIIDDSFSVDFWLEDNLTVSKYLEAIFNPIIKDYDSKTKETIDGEPNPNYDPDFVVDHIKIKDDIQTQLNDGEVNDKFNELKILLEYYLPTMNLEFYKLDKFKIYARMNLNDDVLCELTERTKLCEVYSKLKGNQGKNIIMTIEKVPKTTYRYVIQFTLGDIQETFYVVTDGGSKGDGEYIQFQEISNKSKLVDARLFDYVLESGEFIDQLEFDKYKAEGEVFSQKYDPDEGYDSGVRPVELPEGSWNLGRTFEEHAEFEDYINTLQILKDSDYYPDFLIVDRLNYGTNNLSYLDNRIPLNGVPATEEGAQYAKTSILDYTEYKYTQALIRVDDSHLSLREFPVNQSRMLYFYKDIDIYDVKYNTCYPYVINMIDATYLKIMDFKLIYKLDEEKELELTKKLVNYLKYNNLYYYYGDYYDMSPDPNFIIRFITSKVSRSFMVNEGKLINCEQSEITNLLNDIIWKNLSLLPLVNYINFDYSLNQNTLNITLEVQVKHITNRTFKLNFTLNI